MFKMKLISGIEMSRSLQLVRSIAFMSEALAKVE